MDTITIPPPPLKQYEMVGFTQGILATSTTTATCGSCNAGLEDAEWGQLVVAVVVSNDPQSLNLVELQQHTRQHLAGYKVPRRWLVVDALPHNASAKVDRNAVKELFQ